MPTDAEGRYLFPHTWEGEGNRLKTITDLFDPVTRRHITGLGITEGWNCLEVGAGTGTIARWMAEQVGTKGSVLATDLSLALIEGSDLVDVPNLELQVHDVVNDPLPENVFDLIHTRLVLEHIPARAEVLAKLARSLTPGGWLVVEDITFGGQRRGSRRGAVTLGGMLALMAVMMRRNGFGLDWGRKVPLHMHRAGLTDLGAEGMQIVIIGGTPTTEWVKPTLGRIRTLLVEGDVAHPLVRRVFEVLPPLRSALERRFDALDRLIADPEFVYHAPVLVSAWGRRPA